MKTLDQNSIPNKAESKDMTPALSREKVIETIKNLPVGSEEMKDISTHYFDSIKNNYEKETGQGNVEAYLEMAKIYHDAGFIKQALELLDDGEEGLMSQAWNLGFKDLYEEMMDLANEWESKL